MISTLAIPRDSLHIATSPRAGLHAQKRMREKYEIADLTNTWFDDLQGFSAVSITQLLAMADKAHKLLSARDRLVGVVISTSG